MSGAFVVIALLFAVAIPLALWVAIENETSNPTVVDRAEAERIATERGGRGGSRATADSDRSAAAGDRTSPDANRRDGSDGWGTRSARPDRDHCDESDDRGNRW